MVAWGNGRDGVQARVGEMGRENEREIEREIYLGAHQSLVPQ